MYLLIRVENRSQVRCVRTCVQAERAYRLKRNVHVPHEQYGIRTYAPIFLAKVRRNRIVQNARYGASASGARSRAKGAGAAGAASAASARVLTESPVQRCERCQRQGPHRVTSSALPALGGSAKGSCQLTGHRIVARSSPSFQMVMNIGTPGISGSF